MIDYKKVIHKNPLYRIGRILVDTWHNYFFYRRIKATGKKNIPADKPVLFGPNHQNALMDPMAILCTRFKPTAFFARSDIFEKKFLAILFRFFRMIPVFRIRDGRDKLDNNKEVFDTATYVLAHNLPLTIFPEARHTDKRSVLQLKKGLARVAFAFAEKHDFKSNLHVIPTGIYYTNYFNYRTKVLVNYGEPILVDAYKDSYKQNPTATMLKFTRDLREKILPLTIHIKNSEYYKTYENARYLFDYQTVKNQKSNLKNIEQHFQAHKKVIAKLDSFQEKDPEKFDIFAKKIDKYFERLKQKKLQDYLFDSAWSLPKTIIASILWIALLPLFALSYLNFLIPLCTPELLVKRFKDPQFHSSVRFVASFFFVPLWGLLTGFLLLKFTNSWQIALANFVAQPFLFVFWVEYRKKTKKLFGHWRFHTSDTSELKRQRQELISEFEKNQ